MSALEVLALNEATPQIRAPGVGDTYTMPRPLAVTTSITIAGGTVVASAPAQVITQTWNNAAVAFDALTLDVTNAASASGSKLLNLKLGGAARFSVDKDGDAAAAFLTSSNYVIAGNGVMYMRNASAILNMGSGDDTKLSRLAAGSLKVANSGGTTGTIATQAGTVANLPTAAAAGAGARGFVTDAATTLVLGLGTLIAGGGANAVPVYSDGTNWIYG